MAEREDPNKPRLDKLTGEALTPMVQKALGRPVAVTTWHYQPMSGGFGGGMGGTYLYRFSGMADDQEASLEWSMILKIIEHRPNEDRADPKYWKREYEVYRSGIFNDLPGGLQAARCFGVTDFENESCWLWLEELHDDLGETWPVTHYRTIGQHAGHFSGVFLEKRPLPNELWLSNHWLRKIIATLTPRFAEMQDMLQQPLLRPVLPPDAHAQFARLLADSEQFLSALDQLPQTISHKDYFRRNIFARRMVDGQYQTIAIDWAFVGQAAIGTEAAIPVMVGLFVAQIDPDQTDEHEKQVFEGYLSGLRDMGWNGDSRIVHLGYAASTALKLIELMSPMGHLDDPGFQAFIQSALGCPMSHFVHHIAAMNRLAYRMADEARTLL